MKLVIEDDAGTRSVVPFTAEELTLGRATSGVAWRLPDRNVSRRHARFTRAGGAVFVEDLGSLTGTWLNGERISGRRRVRPGDLVEIGDYDLVVAAEGEEATRPGTPPPLRAAAAPAPAVRPEAPPPVPQGGPGPAAASPAAGRLRRLALLGAAALAAGLLTGLLLGRLSR